MIALTASTAYGGVQENSYNSVPIIVNEPRFSGLIYEGTKISLDVEIKNTGGSGPVTVRTGSDVEDTPLTLPDPQIVTIANGETKTVTLNFKADNAAVDTYIDIYVSGRSKTDKKRVYVTILPKETPNEGSSKSTPGFGVISAIVCVFLVIGLVRRYK